MTVKVIIDEATGEIIREHIIIAVENAPRIIIDINDVKIYHNDPDKLVNKIREQAGYAVFDVNTEKGRAACRSHAANIIKCIAPALNASKALAAEAKKVVNQDLNFRNYFESAVREIAAHHRLPLTEYEDEQEKIKKEQIAREEKRLEEEKYMVDWDDALDLDELFTLRKEREIAHQKAELARIKAEHDKSEVERINAMRLQIQAEEEAKARRKVEAEQSENLESERSKVLADAYTIVSAAFEKTVAERVEAVRKRADGCIDADEIIERLCKLQGEVYRMVLDNEGSADCFCGKSGFWKCEGYSGTFNSGYRNDGEALEFIENAVRNDIDRHNAIITGRGE